MRRIPNYDDRPMGPLQINRNENSHFGTIVHQQRTYSVITPLFGAGVDPKENNLAQLVNGKSVRGQLRFWWRASRGTGDLTKMLDKEFGIWGAASGSGVPRPSKVSVEVSVTKKGQPDTPFLMVGNNPRPDTRNSTTPPYAAFALQPTADEVRNAARRNVTVELNSVQADVAFLMEIAFPSDLREEVEAALWCWETFGGIGGRTRRGFGAIALRSVIENGKDVTPEKWKFRDVVKNINSKLPTILASGEWDERVPHLPRDTKGVLKVTSSKYTGDRSVITRGSNDVLKSWWYLIDKLQQFRQSPRNERKSNGRSDWPEPDEIRRIYTSATGRNTFRTPSHKVRKFPRAQFGLPIVFKFKDDDKGEPPKTTLQGVNGRRLGSPLILRPILCQDGAVSLALILETPRTPDGGIELENYTVVISDLVLGEERDIPPMRGKSAKTDVLRAFLESL